MKDTSIQVKEIPGWGLANDDQRAQWLGSQIINSYDYLNATTDQKLKAQDEKMVDLVMNGLRFRIPGGGASDLVPHLLPWACKDIKSFWLAGHGPGSRIDDESLLGDGSQAESYGGWSLDRNCLGIQNLHTLRLRLEQNQYLLESIGYEGTISYNEGFSPDEDKVEIICCDEKQNNPPGPHWEEKRVGYSAPFLIFSTHRDRELVDLALKMCRGAGILRNGSINTWGPMQIIIPEEWLYDKKITGMIRRWTLLMLEHISSFKWWRSIYGINLPGVGVIPPTRKVPVVTTERIQKIFRFDSSKDAVTGVLKAPYNYFSRNIPGFPVIIWEKIKKVNHVIPPLYHPSIHTENTFQDILVSRAYNH